MIPLETARQVDFKATSEDWGQTILADGTSVETRIILADLVIISEDLLGPQMGANPVVAVRIKCPAKLINEFKDKQLVPMIPPPITLEAGFERIGIEKIVKPTQSTYTFETYTLTISLSIDSAARNKNYKTVTGCPVYNVRWTTSVKVVKV